MREVFAAAVEAARGQACVLFIDEIDTLCPRREKGASHENRVVAQVGGLPLAVEIALITRQLTLL